ncbi:MAG: 50S ribosomal protein L10 [Patescibacteria group bacterium]
MPNERNKKLVKEIKEKIETAKSITFTDYVGISADQANTLRQKVKDAGGEVLVSKNTLFKAAIDENGDKSIAEAKKDLKGPTMTIFGFKDPILPIKALFEFAKGIDLPKIKSAIIEGIYNSSEKVDVIKTIPSREELLTKIVSSMNSPISGFANVVSGVQRKFVFAVNAISKKKSEGGAN